MLLGLLLISRITFREIHKYLYIKLVYSIIYFKYDNFFYFKRGYIYISWKLILRMKL